jgi:predicted DNA-binding transcriptional regulator YafY
MIAASLVAGQTEQMRYQPSERLLRLALRLAGSRAGLSLNEMAADLEVDRRTAERLRDALERLFPQLEHEDDSERVRRWRLPVAALTGLAEPKPEAIAAVEGVAKELASRGENDRAALLRDAAATLRALMPQNALRRAEPDIAALMEAEGTAMRPGPRVKLAPGLLTVLRRAILAMEVVSIQYRPQWADEPRQRLLCPYGILYGGRGWLVGHAEGLPDMRLWRLDRITGAELTGTTFPRDESFSLARYAAQSFGVFQEEPMDVVLRVASVAAEDALTWLFHPSQSMERQPDGSVIVSFRAGGTAEICRHLFAWGTLIDIIAPDRLRMALLDAASDLIAHAKSNERLR